MRIGLFTDTYTPDINGVVSSIVTLQKELEKDGHEVFVVTNHKASRTKREGNILRLPGLELKWLYGYKLSTPYHFAARDEIEKMCLDIIHVHTEFGVGIFGRIVGKYLNIPVVTTYHTMYEDYTHYVNRFDIDEIEKVSKKLVSSFSKVLSDSTQAVISPSEKTKETLLKYGVKTPIYVIPTGLSFEKFNHNKIDVEQVKKIKEMYGIKEDDKVVVFVGRIAPEKSIDIPIEGFRYISDPHIKLMIVGDGPQLEDLKKMVKDYGLTDKVIFTGKKSSDEVPLYYACADCFVSASLTETQGMTYIEALACGLPVFARWDDVLENLVIEGENGFLFDNAQMFADKLISYLSLPKEQQQHFHQNAMSKVVQYDANVFCSKVLSVYYQAIDDYSQAYEVIKIKTLDDCVRIYVQNDSEDQPQKVLITFDDYFSYKIRLHTMLDRFTVSDFKQKELKLEAYRNAVRRLHVKDYTRKEMNLFLQRKKALSEHMINEVLDELEEKGYINDELYIQNKIAKMEYSLVGKDNIRRFLINKGINREDVENALKELDSEGELVKAKKMAQKLMCTIKDTSRKMKKQKIINKLISLGFDGDIARRSAEDLDYEQEDERAALEKTIQKALRSYVRKYQGKELHAKVMMYCIRKGFSRSDIEYKLEEMECLDE